MQHFIVVAERINCVPRFRTYILKTSNAAMFHLYFNRFLEDVNFVILDLSFQVQFDGLSNQCFSSHCSFFPYLLPISPLNCHGAIRKEILVQSLGVSWWAETICSWLSSEIILCITLTYQLPQTILDNFILHKQLANESW